MIRIQRPVWGGRSVSELSEPFSSRSEYLDRGLPAISCSKCDMEGAASDPKVHVW